MNRSNITENLVLHVHQLFTYLTFIGRKTQKKSTEIRKVGDNVIVAEGKPI